MLREQWEAGAFQSSDPVETHTANAQARASIAQLNELIDLDYEQYCIALTGEPPQKDESDDTSE